MSNATPETFDGSARISFKIMRGPDVLLCGILPGSETPDEFFALEQAINSGTSYRCHLNLVEPLEEKP